MCMLYWASGYFFTPYQITISLFMGLQKGFFVMFSRIVALFASLLFSLSLITTAQAESSKPLVIYAADFPPYEIANPKPGGLRGFDVEVVEAAFARVGEQVEIRFLPWKRVVRLVKGGAAAAMLSCAHNRARESYYLFSDPISQATRTYAVSADYKGQMLTRVSDAKSMKVVVVSGYSTENELRSADVPYEAVVSDHVALNLLLYRNSDAFLTTKESLAWIAKEIGEDDKIRFFDLQQSRRDYYLCFSKKWLGVEKLVERFNQGLGQIKSDGTLESIHAKYR